MRPMPQEVVMSMSRTFVTLTVLGGLVWAGCAQSPPAWETANPIVPLPAEPLGLEMKLTDLEVPPTPERVRLGRWLVYETRLSADNKSHRRRR